MRYLPIALLLLAACTDVAEKAPAKRVPTEQVDTARLRDEAWHERKRARDAELARARLDLAILERTLGAPPTPTPEEFRQQEERIAATWRDYHATRERSERRYHEQWMRNRELQHRWEIEMIRGRTDVNVNVEVDQYQEVQAYDPYYLVRQR